jgi:hypothetical protein
MGLSKITPHAKFSLFGAIRPVLPIRKSKRTATAGDMDEVKLAIYAAAKIGRA